jgi:hypothetical protein
MTDYSQIKFLLVSHVEGMYFNPLRAEGLEFTPAGDNNLRFVLRPADPERDACGTWGGLECKAYTASPATKDQAIFVDSYNKHKVMHRVADGISLPFKPQNEILIAEDGSCKEGFRPRRYLFPADISQLIEAAEAHLAVQTDRFLKLLRWRQGIDGPGEGVKHRSLYWRVGEGDYPIAPRGGDPSHEVTLNGMCGIQWDDEHFTGLQELWEMKDVTEPLAHTLVREAATLASESPRSSILIMTAALETAVKMHISDIAPDTAWLMEESPSPPIFKILRDYLPLIYRAHGKELDFWDKVKPFIKKTQKLIEIRNKVAHTGRIPEDAGPIQDDIKLVLDLLYLLDVLNGMEWAKTLASHELRQALGWPTPKDLKFTVTVKEPY